MIKLDIIEEEQKEEQRKLQELIKLQETCERVEKERNNTNQKRNKVRKIKEQLFTTFIWTFLISLAIDIVNVAYDSFLGLIFPPVLIGLSASLFVISTLSFFTFVPTRIKEINLCRKLNIENIKKLSLNHEEVEEKVDFINLKGSYTKRELESAKKEIEKVFPNYTDKDFEKLHSFKRYLTLKHCLIKDLDPDTEVQTKDLFEATKSVVYINNQELTEQSYKNNPTVLEKPVTPEEQIADLKEKISLAEAGEVYDSDFIYEPTEDLTPIEALIKYKEMLEEVQEASRCTCKKRTIKYSRGASDYRKLPRYFVFGLGHEDWFDLSRQ